MINFSIVLILELIVILSSIRYTFCKERIKIKVGPDVLFASHRYQEYKQNAENQENKHNAESQEYKHNAEKGNDGPKFKGVLQYIEMASLVDENRDTTEFWRTRDLLSIIKADEVVEYMLNKCDHPKDPPARFPSTKTVRTACHSPNDTAHCPTCTRFNNVTQCELFRDSCKEERISHETGQEYCDKKYGQYATLFIPSDYTKCQCCDECIHYRELDDSCVEDIYSIENPETLPVTTVDFRAGCNPYKGHPDEEILALRCEFAVRRCIPRYVPALPFEMTHFSMRYRYQPVTSESCPETCHGYPCESYNGKRLEDCVPGGFIPWKTKCNCCGECSEYKQFGERCATFRTYEKEVNGEIEIEIEEELMQPGCDDGMVCRLGVCQDIHNLNVYESEVDEKAELPLMEPCKTEMKTFKKRYGVEGNLHHDAPTCSPLWLYDPVQCRDFICYCTLQDGSIIKDIKVPRTDSFQMDCACAREQCRTGADLNCDGYGNYVDPPNVPFLDVNVRSDQKSYEPYDHRMPRHDTAWCSTEDESKSTTEPNSSQNSEQVAGKPAQELPCRQESLTEVFLEEYTESFSLTSKGAEDEPSIECTERYKTEVMEEISMEPIEKESVDETVKEKDSVTEVSGNKSKQESNMKTKLVPTSKEITPPTEASIKQTSQKEITSLLSHNETTPPPEAYLNQISKNETTLVNSSNDLPTKENIHKDATMVTEKNSNENSDTKIVPLAVLIEGKDAVLQANEDKIQQLEEVTIENSTEGNQISNSTSEVFIAEQREDDSQ